VGIIFYNLKKIIKMAKLYFKYGAMGSGKTLELLRVAYNYIERGQNVLLLSSGQDNRYGKNIIKSRTGIEMPSISINDELDIIALFINENLKCAVDCILVDESQFLSKKHIKQLSDIVDFYDTPVITYGLRSDSKLEPFEGSKYLMTIADDIQEIKSICWCGNKSIINARIIDGKISLDGPQIQIGGNESYISLCRKHFKEGKLGK